MEITDNRIDAGKAFDWGRTSKEYAKYRDIYPDVFYQKIVDRGLCVNGQKVLDLGTVTGVVPRNMYRYGAEWIGTDISPEQIEQAKRLSEAENMDIDFLAVSTEDIDFPKESFDVITACQCFWYFDHERVMPEAAKEMLRHAFEDIGMQKVWCGYYEGNTKSKRVQEKVGFKYQWTTKDVDVPLMHEKRTEYVSLMMMEDWEDMR